ncbi:MAG: hypothetical protein Q9214_004055 [Letrouitia sp. 1 TL-2023]
MAAGKRRSLKLKTGIRLQLDTIDVERSKNIKIQAMASASDQTPLSPMDNASESISPFDKLDPSSTTAQRSMSRSSASLAAQRRRRSSKGSMSSSLKRSASTPNVRGLSGVENGMTLADKRRNKLGYHRTSIACAHCRRRKIRCLLALDDPHNRCSNCIRLKKECNFLPVGEQPHMDRRPRTGSKAGSGEASASSSSSPAMPGGPVVDHFNQFRPLPLSNPEFTPLGAPLSGTTSSPSRRASENSRTYEFAYHPDRSHWDSPFFDHGPMSAGHSTPEDPSHPYWRLVDSPITPGFQFAGPPNSMANHVHEPRSSFTSFSALREDQGWPLPARSLSFGQVEDLSHSNPNQFHPPLQYDYQRRVSEMRPPSLQSSSNNSKNNSLSESSTPPLSATMTSQPMQQFVAPAWNPLPGATVISKAPEYSQWYSEPAPLAKVQEEDLGSSFNGDHTAVFSSAC